MKNTLPPRTTDTLYYERSKHVCICSFPVEDRKSLNTHLFKIYRVSKSLAVRDTLVNKNLGLVKKAIKDFSGYRESQEDLFQAGCIGLMTAIENYDYTLGFAFSTYAMPYVNGFMYRHVQKYNFTIYIPAQILSNYKKISKASIQFSKEHGRNPTINELADLLPKIEKDKIYLTLKAFNQQPCSLDKARHDDEGEGYLSDIVAHPDSLKPDYDETLYYVDVVNAQLQKLDMDMAMAIRLYYVVGCKQTDIANFLNKTPKEVRSLITRGIREVKKSALNMMSTDRIKFQKLIKNSRQTARRNAEKAFSIPIPNLQ